MGKLCLEYKQNHNVLTIAEEKLSKTRVSLLVISINSLLPYKDLHTILTFHSWL